MNSFLSQRETVSTRALPSPAPLLAYGAFVLLILMLAFQPLGLTANQAPSNAPAVDPDAAPNAGIQVGSEERFPAAMFGSWNPWLEMDRIHERMNQLFDQSLNTMNQMRSQARVFQPDLDFVELADRYIARVDLPGINKEEINVEITGDQLVISGERQVIEEIEKEGIYHSERSFGAFKRTVVLPDEVNQDRVKAQYENGVLTIDLPKKDVNRELIPSKSIAVE